MSRELQIIDALVELSLGRREIDLDSIQTTVQRRQEKRDLLPETWKQGARQALRTLAGLGMVQIESDQNGKLRYEKVRLTEQFMNTDAVKALRMQREGSSNQRKDTTESPGLEKGSPTSDVGNSRGDGGGRGNGRDGSDDGGGGGEGFREVLAHPYLFSLSETNFEEILDQI